MPRLTLRARLALGLAAISIVLALPLFVTVQSLQRLRRETEDMRAREFTATLILGQMRASSEELVQAKEILTLFPSDTLRRAFIDRLSSLGARADSVERIGEYAGMGRLRTGIRAVMEQVPVVYQLASSGRGAQADSVVDRLMNPALQDIERVLAFTEQALQDRTRTRVRDVELESIRSRRVAALSALGAALLGLLIAIWLIQSISRPMEDLEAGMRAVSEGDFTHTLRIEPSRRDEFGRVSASYRSMATQLRELDRLKAEFISVASHELKTPINVLIGYLQLLQEDVYGELNPRQREICETLSAQAQLLSQYVRQLLDVSRFEAGGGKLYVRPIPLGPFLGDLERAFRILALQREIAFSVTRGASLPSEVLWDPERMNEVLGNLLSNAFKFTQKGGRVELWVMSEGDQLRMHVRDTGSGIRAEQLPYVFEKFYQGDNQQTPGLRGAGLGLAIAKGIVAAHGGTINVESEVGVGTTFTIVIPARAAVRRATGPQLIQEVA